MNDKPTPDIEALDGASLDVAAMKRRELLGIFPEVQTEGGRIDFDLLRLTLGETIDVGKERYGLSWPGKARCFKAIQAASTGTLLPLPKKSVNWDATENVIIEGDNLEVLKLLQTSYLGRIKMIYIDPPYNTGNDFIYPDNFSESLQTYLEYTGQVDSEARRFGTNVESDGRFHSNWLSMMYPRLYLARNLLRDDGVIFISISDAEVTNLSMIVGELFGEDNVLGRFVWTYRLSANQGAISQNHEYVIACAKDADSFPGFHLTAGDLETLGETVSDACFRAEQAKNPVTTLLVPKGTRLESGETVTWGKGRENFGKAICDFLDEAQFVEGLLKHDVRLRAAWTMKAQCEAWFRGDSDVKDSKGQKLEEIYFSATGRLSYRKTRSAASKVSSHLSGDRLTYSAGRDDLSKLFPDGCIFSYPKPRALIERLVDLTCKDGIVLDFFAGSGTTAEAVLRLNEADHGMRRFICTQLPEPVAEGSNETIADIAMARARAVSRDLSSQGPLTDPHLDRGFRAFALASSNITAWEAHRAETVDQLQEQMALSVAHLRAGRGDDDLLFEVILKDGFQLSEKISKATLAGKTVYEMAEGALIACFDKNLDLEVIKAIAGRKPLRVVLLDEGFNGKDQLKANAAYLFKSNDITLKTL